MMSNRELAVNSTSEDKLAGLVRSPHFLELYNTKKKHDDL